MKVKGECFHILNTKIKDMPRRKQRKIRKLLLAAEEISIDIGSITRKSHKHFLFEQAKKGLISRAMRDFDKSIHKDLEICITAIMRDGLRNHIYQKTGRNLSTKFPVRQSSLEIL